MRVLLDECVSEGLRNYLAEHECQTARYAGFAGLENGQLLTAAEAAKFEVLLMVDRGFEYQQNLGHRQIAVIIFCGKSVLWKTSFPSCPLVSLTSNPSSRARSSESKAAEVKREANLAIGRHT
jgi:hypothetical protein